MKTMLLKHEVNALKEARKRFEDDYIIDNHKHNPHMKGLRETKTSEIADYIWKLKNARPPVGPVEELAYLLVPHGYGGIPLDIKIMCTEAYADHAQMAFEEMEKIQYITVYRGLHKGGNEFVDPLHVIDVLGRQDLKEHNTP